MAIIELDSNQQILLGLLALAHKYGEVVDNEEDGEAPILCLDITIPQEVRELAFSIKPAIYSSHSMFSLVCHQFNENLLSPEVNQERRYFLVEWREIVINSRKSKWDGPFACNQKREMTIPIAARVNAQLKVSAPPGTKRKWVDEEWFNEMMRETPIEK